MEDSSKSHSSQKLLNNEEEKVSTNAEQEENGEKEKILTTAKCNTVNAKMETY